MEIILPLIIYVVLMSAPGQIIGRYVWRRSNPYSESFIYYALPTFIWGGLQLLVIFLFWVSMDKSQGGGDASWGRYGDRLALLLLWGILLIGIPINLICTRMMYKWMPRNQNNKETEDDEAGI